MTDPRFPCIVAHRGASGIAPGNTMPAFKLALEQAVAEVEFDLWTTSDDEVVVCHDPTLDRTTDGSGPVNAHSWAQLRKLDAGSWFGSEWAGVRIPLFEEVFDLLAGRVRMNIHVKEPGRDGLIIDRIRTLAELRDVRSQVYIAGEPEVLEYARAKAPELARCCLAGQMDGARQIACAMEFECERLQFSVNRCTDDDIRRARELGLVTNYYFCDEPGEAQRLFQVGVQALLTNHCERIGLPAKDEDDVPEIPWTETE